MVFTSEVLTSMCLMANIRKVVLGISGGVDSAVAALYLKIKGFEVCGVFMKNWDLVDEAGICSIQQDEEDARKVCHKLKIPFQQADFVKEYWIEVFSNLIKDYESGFTPNPDILCNKKIKFDKFFKYAQENLGADAIATGHYARTTFGDFLEHYKKSAGVHLLRPADTFKDQTFFLSQVNQESLQRTMFPLSGLTKNKVKQIAFELGLGNIAKKKESRGICFIGNRNFQNFISEYIWDKCGNFLDIDTGSVVGEHRGIHQWTLGQRCRISGVRKPFFVAKKDSQKNIIYVASGTDHPSLLTEFVLASQVHWIHSAPRVIKEGGVLNCEFRFQHTKPLTPCSVTYTNDDILIKLHRPLRAITPGQYAVLYRGQECLGSARIYQTGPSLHMLN